MLFDDIGEKKDEKKKNEKEEEKSSRKHRKRWTSKNEEEGKRREKKKWLINLPLNGQDIQLHCLKYRAIFHSVSSSLRNRSMPYVVEKLKGTKIKKKKNIIIIRFKETKNCQVS